ncbi:MAG: helix-turn-helix domain-containing protein [Candidatus Bathyarchaeota archaeon]|nr:helix-turn-helix domain-containing protein [Candidatus Bathyarchaeota archaeon]
MSQRWDKPYHVIIEIENKRCKVFKMLEKQGIHQFKVNDIRSSSKGSFGHLVELDQDQIKKIAQHKLIEIGIEGTKGNSSTTWIESKGCEVCNTILSHGSFLISGRTLQDFTLTYTFIVPSFKAYRNIITVLEDLGLQLKVRKLGKFEPKKEILTEKQEKILWLALSAGYFEFPKKIDSAKLSHKLGISPSTLSEITRRGIRRLLEHYFKMA